jgi:hypothetical protein
MTKTPNDLYEELIEDVAERERDLQENDPAIEEVTGVSSLLERPPETWENEQKSLRTAPSVFVYEQTGHEVDEQTKELLTGLDASINVLDDIIDTKDLGKRERVELTANAAFSGMMSFSNTPDEYRDEVQDMVTQYLTELFQIPMVEQEEIGKIRGAEDVNEAVGPSKDSYSYRARDIDAFARIPSLFNDKEYPNSLTEDLRSFRAKELIIKDIHDVARDLEDNDITPVIELMNKAESKQEAYNAVEDLIESFEYSTEGGEQYGDQLDQMLPEFDRGQFYDFMDQVEEQYGVSIE